MNTQPQTPAQFQAAISGMSLAFRDTLIALIKLQPDIGALAEVMHREREETIALLLNKGVPDSTIEAYRDTMDSIRPHRSDEDPYQP
jgi:hypothetical protein